MKNLNSWIDLFRDNRNERAVMVICGNKGDLLRYEDYNPVRVIRAIWRTRSNKWLRTIK